MKDYAYTLAAGETIELATIAGANRIYCDASSVPFFYIKINDQAETKFLAGRNYNHEEDQIKTAYLRNPNAVPMTINLVIGRNNITDSVTTLTGEISVAASSGLRDVPDVAMPVGIAIPTLVAAAADRKAVIISNPINNTKTYRVGLSPTISQGIELPPGKDITLPTKGLVKAYNPAGAAEVLTVLEILG